jgi:hypothetical protein
VEVVEMVGPAKRVPAELGGEREVLPLKPGVVESYYSVSRPVGTAPFTCCGAQIKTISRSGPSEAAN